MMNKQDIIKILREDGLTLKQASTAANDLIAAAIEALAAGGAITLTGLGTLATTTQSARAARGIIATDTPARQTVKFKPSPALLTRINN